MLCYVTLVFDFDSEVLNFPFPAFSAVLQLHCSSAVAVLAEFCQPRKMDPPSSAPKRKASKAAEPDKPKRAAAAKKPAAKKVSKK